MVEQQENPTGKGQNIGNLKIVSCIDIADPLEKLLNKDREAQLAGNFKGRKQNASYYLALKLFAYHFKNVLDRDLSGIIAQKLIL